MARDCSRIPVEKFRPDNLLDSLDHTTERRLRHAKVIGRLSEALQINQAEKGGKLPWRKFHAVYAFIYAVNAGKV